MQIMAADVDRHLKEVPEKRKAALAQLRAPCVETLAGYEESMEYRPYSERGKGLLSCRERDFARRKGPLPRPERGSGRGKPVRPKPGSRPQFQAVVSPLSKPSAKIPRVICCEAAPMSTGGERS